MFVIDGTSFKDTENAVHLTNLNILMNVGSFIKTHCFAINFFAGRNENNKCFLQFNGPNFFLSYLPYIDTVKNVIITPWPALGVILRIYFSD